VGACPALTHWEKQGSQVKFLAGLILGTCTRHGLWRCTDHICSFQLWLHAAQNSGQPIRLLSSDFFIIQHYAYAGESTAPQR